MLNKNTFITTHALGSNREVDPCRTQ